jgi:hypothetical protein
MADVKYKIFRVVANEGQENEVLDGSQFEEEFETREAAVEHMSRGFVPGRLVVRPVSESYQE